MARFRKPSEFPRTLNPQEQVAEIVAEFRIEAKPVASLVPREQLLLLARHLVQPGIVADEVADTAGCLTFRFETEIKRFLEECFTRSALDDNLLFPQYAILLSIVNKLPGTNTPEPGAEVVSRIADIVTNLLEHGFDFVNAYRSSIRYENLMRAVLRVLVDRKKIAPAGWVDWNDDAWCGGPYPREESHMYTSGDHREDMPTQVRFWVWHLGSERALSALAETFVRTPDDRILNAARAIRRGSVSSTRHAYLEKDMWSFYRPYFNELNRRIDAIGRQDRAFMDEWVRFCVLAYGGRESEMPEDVRRELLQQANVRLGHLRSQARTWDKDVDLDMMRLYLDPDHPDFVDYSEICIRLGGLWRGVKPLLLVLREMKVPCLPRDLRYWREDHLEDTDPLPVPAAYLPAAIARQLHTHFGMVQPQDPELLELRKDFAVFCLERLKTRERRGTVPDSTTDGAAMRNEDIVESNPIWREAYIWAVKALEVNPDSRGHHILHWSMSHDPDSHVREVAAEVYDFVKGLAKRKAPSKKSPRRCVFGAFFWLRYGHALALNMELEPERIQRTRDREVRHTTEPALQKGGR